MREGVGAEPGATKKLAVGFHFARSGARSRDHYDCGKCKKQGYHRQRNCSLHFPDQEPKRYRWSPEYRTAKGTPFVINEVSSEDCPAAYVTPLTEWLLEQEAKNAHIKDGTGATLFGSNVSKWPGWWYDTVSVCEVNRAMERTERSRVDQQEMKHGR